MKLLDAEKKAKEVVARLEPYCKRIMVCGSVRRKKPEVGDIDLVLIPSDPWKLNAEILKLSANCKFKMNGVKIQRVIMADGTQIDIYIANEATWGTLVLIRTGSKESNQRLCSLAKQKEMQLRASGEGLVDLQTGEKLADTEETIFAALGLPYLKPEERD